MANKTKSTERVNVRVADFVLPPPASDSGLRINITPAGNMCRYFITTQTEEAVVISCLYPSPAEAKAGLVSLIKAIQADAFETFDYT